MFAVGFLLVRMLCDLFKPRPRLEAEILILRHQLNVLQQRTPPHQLRLRWIDRALFIWLYRRYPRILDAMSIVRPETVVRWHRKGFSGYWRWRSRSPGGRPRIAREVRDLIRRMSFENSLWGATKIHGELLKLGIAVAQSTVSVYMVPRRGLPSLQWPTPPRYHVDGNRRLGDRDAEFEQFAVNLGGAPQRVLKTHSSDQVAHLSGDPRPASGRAGFPSPVAGKTLAMPAHDSLGPDDAQGIKNARVATIEPDEQGAVDPTQMQSTARRTLLQDVELMPQYQDFGFQRINRQ